MASNEIVNLVLGGSGVAFAAAVYRVIKDAREGSWKRRDNVLADVEKARSDTDDLREWEALQHQWWRDWAGRLHYVITTELGPSRLPKKEPYPKKPTPMVKRSPRRRGTTPEEEGTP